MDSIFTIPNQLTLLRMVLVPVFVTLLIYQLWVPALLVFVVASATDALDGYLARRLNQKSALGAVIDPLADKVMMVSSYVVLSEQGLIPPWLTVMVVSRDVLLVGGVVFLKLFSSADIRIEPIVEGKLTTFFQILTVFFTLTSKIAGSKAKGLMWMLYACTAFMTCLSGYLYLKRGWEHLNGAGKDNQG